MRSGSYSSSILWNFFIPGVVVSSMLTFCRVNTAFTLPKDAVLRAGTNDAEIAPNADHPADPVLRESGKSAQQASPIATDRSARREAAAEARRLMLEDGMPERDAVAKDGPDLGDLEL